MTKVYLSGKMTGLSKEEMNGWREKLQFLIESKAKYRMYDKVHVINPVDYYNTQDEDYKDEKEYIRWEFRSVKTSDVVIVGWNKEQDSLGTMAELTYAYAHNIPVILYFYDTDSDNGYEMISNLHPYIWYISNRHFFNDEIESLAEFVLKYYCI